MSPAGQCAKTCTGGKKRKQKKSEAQQENSWIITTILVDKLVIDALECLASRRCLHQTAKAEPK
jgi:hypothetical protein